MKLISALVISGVACPATTQVTPISTAVKKADAAEPLSGDIVVFGRAENLIGVAEAASEGHVGRADFETRPLQRVGELLEVVPGLIVTQHSGSGKANQYFLRGFNLDHVAAPALAAPMAPREYVMTSGASDLYERTSAQIVLQSTQNAAVRDFARMMLSAHAQSTADVTRAAIKTGLKPMPPKLSALETEMIAQLRTETGVARDGAYIAQQKAVYGGALNVQKAYALDGTAPALRGAAQAIVPVVEQHIAMLMKM